MANFKLSYSRLFYKDLDEITNYLVFELKNQRAASKLIEDVETAIIKRLDSPLSAAAYRSINERQHPYRRILVGNYLIFYVVIDNTMTVRRMLYGRRDIARIL